MLFELVSTLLPELRTSPMRWFMPPQTESQERLFKNSYARSRHFRHMSTDMACSEAAMNSSGEWAVQAIPSSPYGRTTSRIAVETTGSPAERYSGVFVGLMKGVPSFSA